MRGAILATAALALCIATAAHAELGRDDQWRYVPATADHGARAELRGDFPEGVPTQLIFQIECIRVQRVLVFRYDASPFDLPEDALSRRMELILNEYDGPTYLMPTSRRGEQMEGRLTLTSEIVSAVRNATYVMIYAPSDMDEPWHGGDAPALRRVTAECWGDSVS